MEEKVLNVLAQICEDDVVREERDLDLFEEGLLDSLAFAELLVSLEEEVGVVISPSEISREEMSTTNKIISIVKSRS